MAAPAVRCTVVRPAGTQTLRASLAPCTGSAYSTTNSFLSQVRAKFAIISFSENSYGHPSPDTVARLKAHHVRTYTTQRNGSITVKVAAGGHVTWAFSRSSRPQ